MKRKQSQVGMSLIEVMIAVSILSAISLSVIMLGKNMDKSVKSAELKADITEVTREISQILDNKENCSATVFGASGNSSTLLTSIKVLNGRNQITAHSRLRASSTSSPSYVGKGIIINGMYLKWVSDSTVGGNYELRITYIKSVKAAVGTTGGAALARDTFFGQNAETKIISLQLDNCDRYVVTTPQDGAGAPISAEATCTAAGGTVVGETVYFTSANPATPTQFASVGCRVCAAPAGPPGTRGTVKGCL
jgi:prepilin-type N-terminal cleavage/methylation domain-containing protein